MAAPPVLVFESLEEEVRFLRGLVSVQRLADDVLEDCLERRLGLVAGIDVFLAQCAQMIHARGAFVQILGNHGPVVTRVWGHEVVRVSHWAGKEGAMEVGSQRTIFVSPLSLGRIALGTIGFLLPGTFGEGGQHVLALVQTIAEVLDSAVLAFVALADGSAPLERLDALSQAGEFGPRTRVGKYELLHPLGTGGMAQVMVARSLDPGGVSRLVAFKRILPQLARNESIVKQFFDEARVGMLLNHPNLVTVYEFGNIAGALYIAMELIDGVDFDLLIYASLGPLSSAAISGVMCQALEGLHAAHEARADDGTPMGLVHRDMSPHNIMCGFDGRVKLLDFGVAKSHTQTTVTLPGVVKGKPLYMSPEQATAEPLDRRSDVFSMGLILYEALVGRRAFDRQNDTASMVSIVNDALPRPAEVTPLVWAVIERALHKRPEQRFSTAKEMREALSAAVPPMSAQSLSDLMTRTFPDRAQRLRPWGD
jgi:hypothetical protein